MHNQSRKKEKKILSNDLQYEIAELEMIAEFRGFLLKNLKKHFAIKVEENQRLKSELSHIKSAIYGNN